MGFFDYFRSYRRNSTAAMAKERLQIIVAHERNHHKRSADFIPQLRKDLLDVVRKYVTIDQDQVKVHIDREGDCEVLELNIVLPDDEVIARR